MAMYQLLIDKVEKEVKCPIQARVNFANSLTFKARLFVPQQQYKLPSLFWNTDYKSNSNLTFFYKGLDCTKQVRETMLKALLGVYKDPEYKFESRWFQPCDTDAMVWTIKEMFHRKEGKLAGMMALVGHVECSDSMVHVKLPIFREGKQVSMSIPGAYKGMPGLKVLMQGTDWTRELAGAALLHFANKHGYVPVTGPGKCASCVYKARNYEDQAIQYGLYDPQALWRCALKDEVIGETQLSLLRRHGGILPSYLSKGDSYEVLGGEHAQWADQVIDIRRWAMEDTEEPIDEEYEFEDELFDVPEDVIRTSDGNEIKLPETDRVGWRNDYDFLNSVIYEEGCDEHVGFAEPDVYAVKPEKGGYLLEKADEAIYVTIK